MRYAAQSATIRIAFKRVFYGRSRPPKGFALPGGLMLAGALVGGNALGLDLDAVAEQSLLGDPLRIVIPVVTQPGEELARSPTSTARAEGPAKSAQVAAVREQEVVLQKRIDELSEQILRMQQDRIAKLSAEVERLQQQLRAGDAAQRAAEAARRDAPWAAFLRWLDQFREILAAGLVVILAAGVLVWRRRHMPPRLAGLADIGEEAYGDDSMLIGSPTVPRTVPRAAAANFGVDTQASHVSAPEKDFELDIVQHPKIDHKPPPATNR